MSERIDYPPRTRAAIDEWMERKDKCAISDTGDTSTDASGHESGHVRNLSAIVEPDGFCKWAEPRE